LGADRRQTDLAIRDEDSPHVWVQDAACRGAPIDYFFSEGHPSREARDLCRSCSVVGPCLAEALECPFDTMGGGYRGGMTQSRRSRLRRYEAKGEGWGEKVSLIRSMVGVESHSEVSVFVAEMIEAGRARKRKKR
jgi:hypothetical protein